MVVTDLTFCLIMLMVTHKKLSLVKNVSSYLEIVNSEIARLNCLFMQHKPITKYLTS